MSGLYLISYNPIISGATFGTTMKNMKNTKAGKRRIALSAKQSFVNFSPSLPCRKNAAKATRIPGAACLLGGLALTAGHQRPAFFAAASIHFPILL